jgi:hypothetical protein
MFTRMTPSPAVGVSSRPAGPESCARVLTDSSAFFFGWITYNNIRDRVKVSPVEIFLKRDF